MTARDDRSRSTAPTLSSPDTAREAGGRLDWTDLNGQPRSLPLGASVRIGRSSDNDIILNDGRVSRRHARIVAEGGRYLLTDLNSGNGTFVNDAPITGPTELHPGDRIGIGETVLTFGTVAPLSVSEEPALSLPKGSELPRRPERQTGPRIVAATLAAHRNGIRTLIAPSENERDLVHIPEKVQKDMKFIWVENMDQVINAMLLAEDIELRTPEPEITGPAVPAPIDLPFDETHPDLPADAG